MLSFSEKVFAFAASLLRASAFSRRASSSLPKDPYVFFQRAGVRLEILRHSSARKATYLPLKASSASLFSAGVGTLSTSSRIWNAVVCPNSREMEE